MKKTKTKVKSESMAAVADAPLQENGSAGETRGSTLPAPGEFKLVPREKVRPDPNQPRKVFNETKLMELADSIRLNGILSPLVVQAMPARVKIEGPNLLHDDWQAVDGKGAVVACGQEEMVKALVGKDAEDYFQIVFGERRWRAAGLVELKEVPVIVRELTEREVFVHQFVENQARENLSALEEAKSFQERIAKEKETDPSFNADKLAEVLGVARGTVYNRLVLTRLIQPVLDALTAGKIQTTVAGLVAMIPDPKQQEKLLALITDEDEWQFPFSFRDVEEIIEEDYCKQLKDAPFDLKKEDLFLGAVILKGSFVLNEVKLGLDIMTGMSCAACPHRTGNMKDAFPHIKNSNVCTKPSCYQAKCTAHFLDEAAEATRKGQKVLTPKEFKGVKRDYIAGDKFEYASNRSGTFEQLMGKHKPEPVLVVTDEGLKKFFPREDAQAAARKNGVRFREQYDSAKEEAKRKEQEQLHSRREHLAEGLLERVAAGIAKVKDTDAWEIVLKIVAKEGRGDSKTEKALVNGAKSPKASAVGRMLSMYSARPVDYNGKWDTDMLPIWKLLGVDLIEEETKAVDALPLEKAKPQQKELLTVKKTRKRK